MTIKENKKMYCPFIKANCKANECNFFAHSNPGEDGEARGTCCFRWIPVLADMWHRSGINNLENNQKYQEQLKKMIGIMKDSQVQEQELEELVKRIVKKTLKEMKGA